MKRALAFAAALVLAFGWWMAPTTLAKGHPAGAASCSSAGLRTTVAKTINCILGVPSPLPGFVVGPASYCAPPYDTCEDYNNGMGSPQHTTQLIVNFVPTNARSSVLDITEQMESRGMHDAAYLDLKDDAYFVASSDFMKKSYLPTGKGNVIRLSKAKGPLPSGTFEVTGKERCLASCAGHPRIGAYAAYAWYWPPYEFDVSVYATNAQAAQRTARYLARAIWARAQRA